MEKEKAPGVVPGAFGKTGLLFQEDLLAAAFAFGAEESFVVFNEVDDAGVSHA